MAEARAIPSLGGYDEEFVNAVEDELQCAICQLPLKDPMLTKCGHRFCRQCLDEHFRRLEIDRQQSCCPVDRNNLIQSKDTFPDKATERKILSLIIKCPSKGCQWTGELRSKEKHSASCPQTIIACPYAHMGCEMEIQRKEVENHLQTAVRLHFDLACVKLSATQVRLSETEVQLNNTQVQLTNTQVDLTNTQVQLTNTQVDLTNTQEQFKAMTGKLEKKFEEITRKLEEKYNVVEKIMQCSEQSYFDWKISGFSKVLRKAKSGEKTLICSEPFYRFGYKCRLRCYPNGVGSGKSTHLSLFFIVMKGENDGILPWPFHKKVTITLIDQQEDAADRMNIVVSLKVNPEDPKKKTSFTKPVTDENIGSGYHSFVSHSEMKERRYIVDDTIIIQALISLPQ